MPQTKSLHGRARRFGTGTSKFSAKLSVTAELDRSHLIYECLRELVGVELIYAIRCTDGVIKIGWTKNLLDRRKHLSTNPEDILAIKPGTYDEEQAIHAQLKASVARGVEYYHPTPEVLAYVNDMRMALGVGPA